MYHEENGFKEWLRTGVLRPIAGGSPGDEGDDGDGGDGDGGEQNNLLDPDKLKDEDFDSLASQAEGKTVPLSALLKIRSQLKEYSAHGKPADIKERLEKHRLYEEALEEHRKKTQPSEEDQRRQNIFKQGREVGFASDEEVRSLRETIEDTNLASAENHLSTLMKAEGIELPEQDQADIGALLWARMSDAERTALKRGNSRVLDKIVRESVESGFLKFIKAAVKPAPKPTPPIAPRRQVPGGTPPGVKKKPTEHRTSQQIFQDAEEEAFARVKAGTAA